MRRILISLALLLLMISTLGQNNTDPQDYEFYKTEFEKGTIMRNAGIGLVVSGPVLVFLGLALGASQDNLDAGIGTATGFMVVAIIAEAIGIPLSIAGATKRNKNKALMQQYDRDISLDLRTTKHGIGIVLKF